jgi:hypothetical protein
MKKLLKQIPSPVIIVGSCFLALLALWGVWLLTKSIIAVAGVLVVEIVLIVIWNKKS